MRKLIGWILSIVGVALLGFFGWLYIKSDKVLNKFLDNDDK